MDTNLYASLTGLKHETTSVHPERPDRLRVVLELFHEAPFSGLKLIEAEAAEETFLRYAHSQDYIDRVRSLVPKDGLYELDHEVVLSPGSWNAALHAVGAVRCAVDDVMMGRCRRAFCAVRPPGHHATQDKAMGFCLFANVFIGARYAQEKFGVRKIAIVDFDVHHGNGSDGLTRGVDNILLISSHQYPLWPGTGLPKYDIPGKTLNVPLSPGSGSVEMRAAYKNLVFPALYSFAPDLIMISAGFDSHRDDPLAQLEWTDEDYAWLTKELCAISKTYCSGKIISVLEGGYHLQALKRCVAAHVKGLANLE